jgi:hypothetical protein
MSRKKNAAVPETSTRVVLKFDGKSYDIAFGFNDLCEVEKVTGGRLLAELQAPSLELVRGMLFIALRRAAGKDDRGEWNFKLTPEEVGERLCSLDEVGNIFTVLMLAYKASASKAMKKRAPGDEENSANPPVAGS